MNFSYNSCPRITRHSGRFFSSLNILFDLLGSNIQTPQSGQKLSKENRVTCDFIWGTVASVHSPGRGWIHWYLSGVTLLPAAPSAFCSPPLSLQCRCTTSTFCKCANGCRPPKVTLSNVLFHSWSYCTCRSVSLHVCFKELNLGGSS